MLKKWFYDFILFSMSNEILDDEFLDVDPLGSPNECSESSGKDFSADDEDNGDPTYQLENQNENSALRNFYEAAHDILMSILHPHLKIINPTIGIYHSNSKNCSKIT